MLDLQELNFTFTEFKLILFEGVGIANKCIHFTISMATVQFQVIDHRYYRF